MELSLFDVLGPVMIGPSSSHTAGAAKLARVAREIVSGPFFHARFALHGSFAETYLGHGTDRALVAGALGLAEDDEGLRDSFELAKKAGLTWEFCKEDLGERVHENTVKMTFFLGEQGDAGTAPTREIVGSSLGGGRILITRIDGFDTEITLSSPTIVVMQRDLRGAISAVTGMVAGHGVNIANMKVSRSARGQTACCVLEIDGLADESLIQDIRGLPLVLHAQVIGGRREG